MNRILRRILAIVGGLLAVVVLAVVIVAVVGWRAVNERVEVTPTITDVPTDTITVARGKHLVDIYACRECHGEDLSGAIFGDVPPMLIAPSNLTHGEGGVAGNYATAGDWDRAIRHGVKPDGSRTLVVMPAEFYHGMSDADASALIAYLMTLQPVDHVQPASKIKPLGFFINGMSGNGLLSSMEKALPHAPAMSPEPTKAYGHYLSHVTCIACHGDKLLGGEHQDPDGPPGPNLGMVAAWSLDGFKKTLREGVDPAGKQLDPHWMPWHSFRHMTDVEMEALYKYLSSLLSDNLGRKPTTR